MNTIDREIEARIPVPEHARGVLLAIAYGWEPAPMTLGPVEHLRYNGVDLSELAPEVRLQPDRLIATLGGSRFNARIGELMPVTLDGQLEGTLVGGATFHSAMVLRMAQQGEFSQEAGPHASLTIEAADWTVLNGQAPSLWIGRIEGAAKINFGGNMIVERIVAGGHRAGHRRHFCLSGAYSYYLVQGGDRGNPIWHLLVDTGAGMPDREVLGRDFLLLQFVFGRQLRMPELVGVTVDLRTVASTTGTGARTNLQERSVSPVPIERNNDEWVDEAWVPVFFERVSAAWTSHPKSHAAYCMAFDGYLDAMTLHLDADYLRLQIALEAFSYWVLRLANQEERMVVKDKAIWKKWVKDNSDAIRALASAGFEESLIGKVMGVYRLSSGRVVPSAFLVYETTLTPEMVAELEGRDVIVHQGFMAPDGYDVERDLQRVAMVRTMLVALVAKAVDYGGAINGWALGHSGYPLEPQAWWSVREDDRQLAQRTFVAEGAVAV